MQWVFFFFFWCLSQSGDSKREKEMEAFTCSFVALNPVTDFAYMTWSVTLLDHTYTGSLRCLNYDVDCGCLCRCSVRPPHVQNYVTQTAITMHSSSTR
jgi:hypothetical protein